jgi:hypothetical protein
MQTRLSKPKQGPATHEPVIPLPRHAPLATRFDISVGRHAEHLKIEALPRQWDDDPDTAGTKV